MSKPTYKIHATPDLSVFRWTVWLRGQLLYEGIEPSLLEARQAAQFVVDETIRQRNKPFRSYRYAETMV